jgi:hypothetical protein
VVSPGSALSTYVYSTDGLHRKRKEGNQWLLQVWNGMQILQERNVATGAEVTRYLL